MLGTWKAIFCAVGILVAVSLVWAALAARDHEEKYERIMSDAEQRLLDEAPIGSDFDHVVEVLKKQSYDSTWELDEDQKLRAVSDSVILRDFTWSRGPASWDLLMTCQFESNKLQSVHAVMRPTGL